MRNDEDSDEHDKDVFDQVDADGEVVKNIWQDCQDGCPGTSMNDNNL